MKHMTKRILVIICAITLFVTSLTTCIPQVVRAEDNTVEIAIDIASFHGVQGFKTAANGGAGYLNINYTGMESDFAQHNGPVLTEAWAEENIIFGGGMTYADLSEGAGWWYLATNSILQLGWQDRATAFTEGWSFTLKAGAPMPYKTTAGTVKNAVLDKDYTFTFCAGNDDWDNIIKVTGKKTTSFSLRTGKLYGSGNTADAGTVFEFGDNTFTDASVTYVNMLDNSVYKDYVDFNGVSFDSLAGKNVKLRYVLDTLKCFQIESWGELRSEFSKGSQIIFKKDLPITYTDTAGNTCEARLDATYIYECMGSNADHDQLWSGVKMDDTITMIGLKTSSYGSDKNYVNINFDDGSQNAVTITGGGYVQDDLLKEYIAQAYIDLSGCNVDLSANGAQILFIPTANVFQLAFGDTAKELLTAGDTIIFKAGMPIAYNNGENVAGIAALDNDYVITVTEKTDTKFKVSVEMRGSYGLKGTMSGPGDENNCYYFDAPFDDDAFSDRKEDIGGVVSKDIYEPLLRDYVEVSGKTGDTLVTDGWYMGRWMKSAYKMIRFYCPKDKWDLAEGDYVMFKKGLPLTYTNSSGKEVTACLDKDYGFVYNGSKFVYDATLGNEVKDTTFSDTTLTKIHKSSSYTEAGWAAYMVPERLGILPGKAGETSFVAVNYEVDGNVYTADAARVAEGLCLTIPADVIGAEDDGITVTVKAGKYESNDSSAGITITSDFTFYVIGNSLTTDYDFNAPEFTSDVFCDIDHTTYTIKDADTVTIDGVTYHRGDEFKKQGTHTLTYTLHKHEYSRTLYMYRLADANANTEINLKDLVHTIKYVQKVNADASVLEAKAMDMDSNGTVEETDQILLGKYLMTDSGVLPTYPTNGTITARPSEAAAALITDYTPEKAESIRTGKDIYYRDVTTLKWFDYDEASSYTVKVSTNADMSEAETYTADTNSLELINLLADTDYYWTVGNGNRVSGVQTFHTAATIRTLTIDGVSNTRDGGGWNTVDGGTIKQGMYFRGANVDSITDTGKAEMKKLGIKTDLDLRKASETAGITQSPIGEAVTFTNISAPYYWNDVAGINCAEYKDALVTEIKTFAAPANYPIYVHCAVGRDRTGTICFLINALCGVSKDDLYLDYEFSLLSSAGTEDGAKTYDLVRANFETMYNKIQEYAPNGTIAEATEAFLLSIDGVEQEDINSIRAILVEK